MKRFTIQSFSLVLLAILFSLSNAQIRIVSKSYSFLGTPVATPTIMTRTESFNLDWKNTDRRLEPANAFIGISGIDVQTSRVDFTMDYPSTTSDVNITLRVKAGPNCAINSIQAFVLSTFDCKL